MMRSSSLLLLGVLVLAGSVQGIFRPPRPYGGGDHCEQDPTTKKSTSTSTTTTTTTTTTTVPTTTTTAQKTCPEGFTLFDRTPSASNLETSAWCLKVAVQEDPIAVSSADALCAAQADGAVLSAMQQDSERTFVYQATLRAVVSNGFNSGAIAVDGRRTTQCTTRNRTVLDMAPCNQPDQIYYLRDGHTDPSYMWSHWAANEPSTNMWTYDIESCLQYAVIPSNPQRNSLLNDIYCDFIQPPNDPTYTLYWNFGALCGVAPK